MRSPQRTSFDYSQSCWHADFAARAIVDAEGDWALRSVGVLILHLVPVLLALLLGWGLGDVHGFVSEPARLALLIGIFTGAAAFLLLGIDLNPLRPGDASDPGQTIVLMSLALMSLALLRWLAFADRAGLRVIHAPGIRWLGLTLCALGGVVRVLALRRLGPQFSAYVTLQPGHELIDRGIYARIRHPLYLSLLLAGPGLALVFRSRLVWPILIGAMIFVFDRIRREETLLASRFGPQFAEYRDRTWALVPLLF